jgi:hypothetical protein
MFTTPSGSSVALVVVVPESGNSAATYCCSFLLASFPKRICLRGTAGVTVAVDVAAAAAAAVPTADFSRKATAASAEDTAVPTSTPPFGACAWARAGEGPERCFLLRVFLATEPKIGGDDDEDDAAAAVRGSMLLLLLARFRSLVEFASGKVVVDLVMVVVDLSASGCGAKLARATALEEGFFSFFGWTLLHFRVWEVVSLQRPLLSRRRLALRNAL